MLWITSAFNTAFADEQANVPFRLQIPAQSLDKSLVELSNQTDLLLLFPYRVASKLDASAIEGDFTLNQALEVLLKDTGYSGRLTEENVLMISLIEPPVPNNKTQEDPSMKTKKNLLAALIGFFATSGATQSALAQDNNVEPSLEEVVVTGIRGSLKAASDLKQLSSVVQDSIVAEDLGKFPDQNVAESLQRIPGVTIDRQNGEGSKITVRGFGPAFNVVRLNNRTMATSEISRAFDFQVLASELIAGADVMKSPMAKTPDGSIGAYVNVKTARPLDNPGMHFTGSLHAKHSELADTTNPEYSAVFSNTFLDDKVGFNLSFSHTESENRYDSAGTSRWLLMSNPSDAIDGNVLDTNGNIVDKSTLSGLRHAGRVEFSQATEDRERTGFGATLQFAPDETWTNTVDFIHTDFSAIVNTQGLQAGLQFPNWRDVVINDNNTIVAGNKFSGNGTDYRLDGLFQVLGTQSETSMLGFNSIKELGNWTLEFDVSQSSSESQPRQDLLVPNYVSEAGDDSLDFDFRGSEIPNIDTTIDYADPNVVRAHWNQISHFELEDDITEARFDATYEMDMGILEAFSFGVATSEREKVRERYETLHPDNCGLRPDDPDEEALTKICGAFRDMPNDIFSVDANNDFMSDASGDFPRSFLFADFDAYHTAISEMTDNPNWPNEQYIPVASTKVKEDVESFYGQIDFRTDLGWAELYGNAGVRYVDTSTVSTGSSTRRIALSGGLDDGQPLLEAEYSDLTEISIAQNYSNVLPSLNTALAFGDNIVVRAAAAKVMSRPAIDDIGVQTNYRCCHAGSFGRTNGNPYLTPYEATQYDIAFEYYGDSGSYAISYFRKEIDTYISQTTILDDAPDVWNGSEWVDTTVNIETFGNVSEAITTKQNRKGGLIEGVELAAQHNFDYLPGFFSGFGVQANYTWAQTEDSGSNAIDLVGVKDPGNKLEGFAENSYNVVAFYDKNGFQSRLAYNWRDDFLHARSGTRSLGLPEHTAAYGQFDFSASYDVSDNVTITGEAINLTNENVRQYADVEERVLNVQYTGPRYRMGVRVNF